MPPKKRSRSATKVDDSVAETPTATRKKMESPDAAAATIAAIPAGEVMLGTTHATRLEFNAHTKIRRNVEESATETTADGISSAQNIPSDLRDVVLRSSVIAPDVVGIRCIALHPDEREMVLAREDGSLVLYSVENYQNISHFQRLRHTGGRSDRTITRLRYLPSAFSVAATHTTTKNNNTNNNHNNTDSTAAEVDTTVNHTSASMSSRSVLIASYLSGQLVVYCGQTLAPLHVHQRTGGAVWDFCIAGPRTIYTAMADGAWQQLRVCVDRRATFSITLQRIVPKVTGADRALSVCCSQPWRIVAGTDDGGHVTAWRLPPDEDEDDADHPNGNAVHTSRERDREGTRRRGGVSLHGNHEPLWTSHLAKGMGLCCALSHSTSDGRDHGFVSKPFVAVGTSIGDVVLFDATHGQAVQSFSHHKGPVSTIIPDVKGGVFYASGWHESLRSYRCSPEGEWYPAEVKRRTHYHEASELILAPQNQLIFSAARDGTIMYTPLASLFTSPAMYVPVTTQQFAFAKAKNVLLQSRRDRIEGFRTDTSMRHWTPLFAYKVHGKFHLQGMWCDELLHYVLFATDERSALLRLYWHDGGDNALALRRIEEVAELPVGRGVLDCLFTPPSDHSTSRRANRKRRSQGKRNSNNHKAEKGKEQEEEEEEEEENENNKEMVATQGSCHVLLDDVILHITLAEGYPIVSTALPNFVDETDDGVETTKSHHGIEPLRLLRNNAASLTVCGRLGRILCSVSTDGTIDMDSFICRREATMMATCVPWIRKNTSSPPCPYGGKDKAPQQEQQQKAEAIMNTESEINDVTLVALTSTKRYGVGLESAKRTLLPRSLPHDVTFFARLPPDTSKGGPSMRFLAYFSRGLMYVTEKTWCMLRRCTIEAAFVLNGNERALVLVRNLEGTLEALPMCWKVRRFGN